MAYPLREDYIDREKKMSEAVEPPEIITEFGWGEFEAGDTVEFFGLEAEVVEWCSRHELLPWMVPVRIGNRNENTFLSILHADHLTFIYRNTKEEIQEAHIGKRDLAGVWQPTGEHFEVMFRLDDPCGTFRMRERQQ